MMPIGIEVSSTIYITAWFILRGKVHGTCALNRHESGWWGTSCPFMLSMLV